MTNQAKTFQQVYEDNKHIKGSPFDEILIYDNEKFSEVNETFEAVYTDALRVKLFEQILAQIGGRVWKLRDFIDDSKAADDLQALFVSTCLSPFQVEIDKKTVAQRIYAARQNLSNPVDYGPNLRSGYEDCGLLLSFERCRLTLRRFALFRTGTDLHCRVSRRCKYGLE